MAKLPTRNRLISAEEAEQATTQHTKPCSDCPWSRTALPGWLGSMSPDDWLHAAHGEALIECHTLLGAQCAGASIYRTNVAKLCRNKDVLRLPANKERVFASAAEFLKHHCGEGT